MGKNLLVDWLNTGKQGVSNFLSAVQNVVNNSSATNVSTVNTPNTPTQSVFKTHDTGMKTAVAQPTTQPVLQSTMQTQATAPTGLQLGLQTGMQMGTPQQSKFIGFQQQTTQPTYNTSTVQSTPTLLDKVNDGKYYNILSNYQQAVNANKKEQERYRTLSEAMIDFQGDVLKNNGQMSDWQLTNRYPEFADNLDSLKELQTELRPIIQSGKGVDPEQIAQLYPELLQPQNIKNTETVKKEAAEAQHRYDNVKKIMDTALTLNIEGLSSTGLKVARDYDTIFNIVDAVKDEGVVGGANDYEILQYLINNYPKVKELWNDIKKNEGKLTSNDKAILNREDANALRKLISKETTGIIYGVGKGLEKLGLGGNSKATEEQIDTAIKAKEKLESDFANQTWKKLAVEINVPLDSLEKFAYRTYKDIQNKVLEEGADFSKDYLAKTVKKAFKNGLGVDLSDEQVDSIKNLYDTAVTPSLNQEIQTNKQNVMDYLESVNKEYQTKKGTLDEDIENYTNNMSMTRALLNRDFRGFTYKSTGEAAQNAEMPLMVLAGTVAPEIVLPLMTMDSYARESQESFEELMEVQEKMGIPKEQAYDNAQEGSAIVGVASAAVEVGLEKVLGGVETTASKAFHDLIMRDFAEKTTKMVAERGLVDLLKKGMVTQFRSSFEEGLEEIVQQWIHNKAIQKYDPDQKWTDGLLQSFEGGFFNWMNLLGGGGDILSNIQQNKTNLTQNANQTAYNAGVKTRNLLDRFIDNGGTPPAGPSGAVNVTQNENNKVTTQQNTAITPVNNNIQTQDNGAIELQDEEQTENQAENKNTSIKEGGLTDKVLEQLNGLDENTRERIKKNPYSVQESKNLIDEMENNPGIDFGDYQNGRYEDVLNEILGKLEQKEDKRRNDIGSLYDKLEQANTEVDVSELKNKVAEFEAQAESLEDIITTAEQAQIKTILKNIQEIGDGTMDVWKVRRIADKWTKGSASSSYDGIGLIRDIRDTIDSVIREQNPDMKEVDKAYRQVLNEISEIKGKLFYKKGGQVKSNAVSTVKNMLNAGNRIDLNNLEKYLPGIKDQLEAIRDAKFVYNAYTTGKGSRFISGIARGVFGNLGKALGFVGFGWGGLLGGAILDAAVDKGLINLTRTALKKTITQETEKSRAELERINKKIEEGKQLDAADKARLKALGEKIMQNAEQMAKEKGKKAEWDKFVQSLEENETPQTTAEEQEKNKVTKKKATKKNKVTEKKAETKKVEPKKEVKQTKAEPKITKDSEGNTLSKEDQERFGNSKIVDKDGNLLVVLHGSSSQEIHDTYDETKAGSNVQADFKGVYFTDNLDLAEQFAHEQLPGSSAFRVKLGKRGHLYKSYLNITNPLNLNTATNKELLQFFKEDSLTKNWDTEKRLSWLEGHPQSIKFHVDMNKVEDAGYDGMIVAIGKEGEGNEYIVFKGNQAKNIGEVEAPVTEENKSEVKKEKPKNKVTAKNNDILLEETPQIAEEDTRERDRMNELEQNETPQTSEEEQVKNKVTSKKTKATTPKVENKVETKEEVKPETKSDLRSKIGDRFYEYMEKQVELTNATRKGNNGLTGEPLNLKDVTMEELLPKYIDKFEKISQEEIKEIQKEIDELTKDRPKAEMTDAQRKQLNGITDQNERNKLLKKWQDEWLESHPISDEDAKKLSDLMERAAEVVEGHKKARNYLYELEEAEENKEYEDHYSNQEESKTKATDNAKNKVTNIKVEKGEGKKVDNSSITGKFRNLTLDDYKAMQDFQGLENYYMKGDEDTAKKLLIMKDAVGYLDLAEFGLPEDWEIDYTKFGTKYEAEKILEIQDLIDTVVNKKEATNAQKEIYEDYYTTDKKGNVKWDWDGLEDEQKTHLDELIKDSIGTDEDINQEYVSQLLGFIKDGLKEGKVSILYEGLSKEKLNELVDKYGAYWRDNGELSFKEQQKILENQLANNLEQNETAQIPTIFEEDLEQNNLRELENNETPQTDNEEMEKSAPKTYDEIGKGFESYDKFDGVNGYYGKIGDYYIRFNNTSPNTYEVVVNPKAYEMFEGVPLWTVQDEESRQTFKFNNEQALSDFIDNAKKNGVDTAIEEYNKSKPKNLVTKKESKPKNVLTNPVENSAFDTLPEDVSVLQESKELGPKRISPDKVLRQQLSFDEGVDKINDNLKTIAEYMKVREQVYTSEGYNDRELNRKYGELKSQVQNILYGVYWENGLGFNSSKSKEFNDLWKNIKDNENNEKGLKEVAKNFYISKVKKDISKGYVYPQEVLDKIPGAEKAVNARQRYQKGLDTSFSAKDERIDYSEKDKIGAGIKSQDGKQVTKEQKEDIVKGILDFGETFGLDMKKFAEDRGLVYVHLHGGSPFLTKYGGLYREATNAEGEKNISVSVGGAENVRYKDKKTGKWENKTLNTTMSHELGHAMDYLTDNKLLGWSEMSTLKAKYNPVNRMKDYYARRNEVTARAIEQYVAVENGQANYYDEIGEITADAIEDLKWKAYFEEHGLDKAVKDYLKYIGSYYERPGYWSKEDYQKYVKPYVEEAFKNNFDEYKLNKTSKNSVTASDLNKVTNKVNADRVYKPEIVIRLDEKGNPIKKNDKFLTSNEKNKVTSRPMAESVYRPKIVSKVEATNHEVINGTDSEMRANLSKILRAMRNDAIAGGLRVSKYTDGGPLENALRTIWSVNHNKKDIIGSAIYDSVLDDKVSGMMQIANIIDAGYSDEDIHYKRFYDPFGKEGYKQTLIFWKGDTLDDALKQKKPPVRDVHLGVTDKTMASIDKFRDSQWRLERTPKRSRFKHQNTQPISNKIIIKK